MVKAQVKGTALGEAGTANDVITKIPSVYADNGIENIYNLNGVRISTAKGLCIKNGKKVFVK